MGQRAPAPAHGELAHTRAASRQYTFRLSTVGLLFALYLGLSLYFHLALEIGVVVTHLAYLPIALATLWWGWRGLSVLVLVAVAVIALRLSGLSSCAPWSDLARLGVMVAVAICLAALSEKLQRRGRQLARSEANYRALFKKVHACAILEPGERIALANEHFARLLGYEHQALSGRPMGELIYADDRDRASRLFANAAAGLAGGAEHELRMQHADGHAVWVQCSCSLMGSDGRQNLVCTVIDLTARKRAEQRQQELSELARQQEDQLVHSTRLAELGEMAAAVAHELNQPLTGIRNFARNAIYMLENELGDEEEMSDTLSQITKQVDRAARIINQMRQLARKEERAFAVVDINGVLKENLDFLKPQFDLNDIQLRFAPDPDLPEAWGDRMRLEQVFLNLMNNARQAMEDAPRRELVLSTHHDAGSDLPIRIEIADTGSGFDPLQKAQLFAPFYSTKRSGKGTGLGLSISLRIIQDHDGQIDADGQPGEGARFTVRLPARREGAA
ncbi:MAG: PAS domain S-box protein [Deltaproteobacteria bacterium]|nr:PAS domain S-box protein [Deltaproteobacteria bacterium]